MTTEVLKDMHTKIGEARGSKGRAMSWTKTLSQNFNAGEEVQVQILLFYKVQTWNAEH